MFSGIVTAVLLGLFLSGTVWAFSPKRKRDFDDAAALPLREDDVAQTTDDTVGEMQR